MKRLFLCVLFTVCAVASSWGQNAQQQAEVLYRQGKFAAALELYEAELKNSPNDPYVYYNIGNCYFKMGSKGLAAANYYRAFKLAPRDADIRHNLTLALDSGGERLVPAGVPVLLHQAFFYLSYPELKGLTFILFWFFCTLASIWLLKRRFGRMMVVCGIIGLLCGGWLYLRYAQEAQHLAVIAAPVAEIRSGPGTNFPASASAAQGHLVTIQDTKDDWYEVIVKTQGIKGWVEKDTVEQI